MATVTGFTAAHMQAIEDATITDADIDISGHLIFTRHDGSTFDAGSALPALPAATTTASGIVELATSAETTTGTDATRAITPAGLAGTTLTVKTLATNSLLETDPITSYPLGVSHMTVGSGSGWTPSGGFGLVVTHYLSTTRSIQWFHNNQTADTWVRNYYDTDVPQWEPWRIVAVLDSSGNLQLGSGKRVNVNASSDTATFSAKLSAITDKLLSARVTTDANNRFHILGDGTQQFGNGTNAPDARFLRSGGSRLRVEDELDVAATLYIGSVSQGSGIKLGVNGFNGSSSTSGTTAAGPESALNTSVSAGTNSMVWVNGHLFEIVVMYSISDNINSAYSVSLFRVYSSGGTALNGWSHTKPANGHLGMDYTKTFYLKRVAGSNLTAGFGVTIQRYISGVAGSSFLDYATFSVKDVGLVSDHSGLAAIANPI